MPSTTRSRRRHEENEYTIDDALAATSGNGDNSPSVKATLRQASRPLTMVLNTNSALPASFRPYLSDWATWYGLSPLWYTSIGFLALAQALVCPGSMPEFHFSNFWSPRAALVEACLTISQGAWSFLSDVKNVSQPSIFHPMDRICAISLVLVQLLKFFILFPHMMSAAEKAWVWSALIIGLFCKVMGSRATTKNMPHAFAKWHTRWHSIMPAMIGSYLALRWCLSDSCYAPTL